jgi:Reverse transcriptase (RNA-dependent DNA polymerase)
LTKENSEVVTRSGRVSKPPARFDDYLQIESVFSIELDCYEQCDHPVVFSASTDPDVLQYHEAMKQPDRVQFIRAMVKEIQAHTDGKNWIIVKRSTVPKGHQALPAVWAMHRKRKIDTREVYKWKARINIHGGKQTKGINYWDTYALVATWASIRLIMNMAAAYGWVTRQLDFVLAFPQAPVETELYMEIPKGFVLEGDKSQYVLKLVNNLYGQKQAGRVWYKFLSNGLCEMLNFQQSKHDPCVFWRGTTIIAVYTDDTIVTVPNPTEVDKAISDIAGEFQITNEPAVSDFLGVKIHRNIEQRQYTLTQPHLIQSILSDLGLKENSKPRDVPALSSAILQRHLDKPPHDESWHYRSVIGKLYYLEKCSRPDIAYAVHQCARFAHNPRS